MGFIDWLLPKEYLFFDMLKEHSAKTVRGAHRFQDFIRDFSSLDEEKKREYMKEIKHIEEEADFQRASRDFVGRHRIYILAQPPSPTMEIWTIGLRFLTVFLMALVFGLERQRAHKPISFGTFIFVAMGACGLGIVAVTVHADNPLPILGAIVTGIGFLGAGALIKTTDKVFGFTTAAAIWAFSIIGLMVGIGEYLLGGILYTASWAVVLIDNYLKVRGIGLYQKKITLVANKNLETQELAAALGTRKYRMVSLDINPRDSKVGMTLLVEGTKEDINHIPARLWKEEWVDSFKLE